MKLIKIDKFNNKVLETYSEAEQFTMIGDEKILPVEQQKELVKNMSNVMTKGKSKIKHKKDLTLIAQEIVKRLQDKRLKEPGKVKTYAYSYGGSKTLKDDEERKKLKAKTQYTVLELDGIVVLEALGQEDNATFITERTADFAETITTYGRKEILKYGFYKIIHAKEPEFYNEEFDHILKILDMILEDKESFLNALEGVRKSNKEASILSTVKNRYMIKRLNKSYSQIGKAPINDDTNFTEQVIGELEH